MKNFSIWLKNISGNFPGNILLNFSLVFCIAIGLAIASCKKNGNSPVPPVIQTGNNAFDINSITDTYGSFTAFSNYQKWGSYNVHDPAIIKSGDWYYCYSTDAAYGIDVRLGLQIRKSKDLVEWQFVGWVFNLLPGIGAAYITQNEGQPYNSLWAPCIVKTGNEFRLYYSLSCSKPRLSVIGLATATNPEGPWVEKGIVVGSKNDNTVQTNAIDPSVVITSTGEHWMVYGSAWDGIYILQLNAETGLALNAGDKGKRIANRGFTSDRYNGNIEGADLIYNPQFNKYYLFIAYDWLETKYNVRVVKSDKPNGPFYDFNGIDANVNIDHVPMILAPYKFGNHSGWQGTAHSAAFSNSEGQFFLAHQGRPGIDKYFMDLHIRKLFWTTDGWPVASPERYAWEKDSIIAQQDIIGDWEQIILGYNVLPGYQAEQVNPDFQQSVPLNISSNGTLNNSAQNTWTYNPPWLTLTWANGYVDKVFVQKGRDWENKKTTIIFSGLNNKGTAIWGKKK